MIDILPDERLTLRYPILALLAWQHLPDELAAVSQPICECGWALARANPDGSAEIATALRRLREAKDAAVGAALDK